MKGLQFSKSEATTAVQSPSNLIRFSVTSVSLNLIVWPYLQDPGGRKSQFICTKLLGLKGVKSNHDFFLIVRGFCLFF